MIDAIGGVPPVMLGIALLLGTTAWSINKAGPELREWVALRRKKGD